MIGAEQLVRALDAAGELLLLVEDRDGRLVGFNEPARRLLGAAVGAEMTISGVAELRRAALADGAAVGRVTREAAGEEPAEMFAIVSRTNEPDGTPAGYVHLLRRSASSADASALMPAHLRHDLRTALSGILGFAELMASERLGTLPARHREILEDISTAAQRALVMVAGSAQAPPRGEGSAAVPEAGVIPWSAAVAVLASDDETASRLSAVIRRAGRASLVMSSRQEAIDGFGSGTVDSLALDPTAPAGEVLGLLRRKLAESGDDVAIALVAALREGREVLVQPIADAIPVDAKGDEIEATLGRVGVARDAQVLLVGSSSGVEDFGRGLAGLGLRVASVESGTAALEAIRGAPATPDVIVVDLALGNLQGLELVSQVGYVDALGRTPVVAIVGPSTRAASQATRAPAGDPFVVIAKRGPDGLVSSLKSLSSELRFEVQNVR